MESSAFTAAITPSRKRAARIKGPPHATRLSVARLRDCYCDTCVTSPCVPVKCKVRMRNSQAQRSVRVLCCVCSHDCS